LKYWSRKAIKIRTRNANQEIILIEIQYSSELDYLQRILYATSKAVKAQFHAKGLDKAKETLDYLKMSDTERLRYERHQEDLHHSASVYESTFVIGKMEGLQEGMEAGLEKGREKGREESVLIIAKNMKSAHISVDIIQQVTGLSLEQIQALKAN
jgi:flagellar biosynthesis/type III secretory pathway protein FliH